MPNTSNTLALIPLFPLLGAVVNLLLARQIPRRATHLVAVLAVFAAFCTSAWLVFGPLWSAYRGWDPDQVASFAGLSQRVFAWIHVTNFQVDLAFRLDTLTAVMLLVITGVGTLIHIYSTGYMAEEPRYAAYFGYLNLFTAAMLTLVLADNLLVLFIGWEGVGLCSYLLIGFWFTNDAYASAGKKAFIVNRIGDFSFILGICLLFWATGQIGFRELQDGAALASLREPFFGLERTAFFAGLFLFIGACGKSAQLPLYVWLPDAMAGPTPVSALIHAATMVTAGVYMVARLSFVYAQSATAMVIVSGVGALTALFAAIMAFAQTDIKKVLAYSTVSQLGFMFVGVGTGAYVAGIFHLMTHAVFKAGLFLGAGSVMHAMSGSGDIMKMGGLRKKTPRTAWTFLIFCLAIAGVFPFAGFFSKDEILVGAATLHLPAGFLQAYGRILWAILMIAATGTAFYMFRLYFLVFEGECRADEETRSHIHESPASMTVPLMVLAALSLMVGWLGMPHLFHLPNAMAEWLNPVFVPSEPHVLGTGEEVLLLALALVAAIGGIALAWTLYRKGPSQLVSRFTATELGGSVHEIVFRKFYVDELYDLVVVRPLRWFGKMLFEVVDWFLIDFLFVNGSAFVVDLAGRFVRWFQNGQIQRYLVVLLVGSAALLYFASRPTLTIHHAVLEDGVVRFAADVGGGVSASQAELEWDFNGDGRADSDEQVVTWNFGRPGSYEVTLSSSEPVFGRTKTVKATVVVPNDPRWVPAGGGAE